MYSKEQVLKIVDACFHMFASSYRIDAKEEAVRILKIYENEQADSSDTKKERTCGNSYGAEHTQDCPCF